MGLYYYGLETTSASYSLNFLNLIPIVTFAIAVILGLEKLSLGNWPGRMKVVGTVMCVGGTMMVSLLKGRLLHLWPTTHLLMSSHAHQQQQAPPDHYHHQQEGMVAGTLFLCGSCLSYALWFIVQARVAMVFPSKYWATMLTCLIGSVQSFVVGIFLGHGKALSDEWRLKWDLQLLTVVYSVRNYCTYYYSSTYSPICC
jgi:drug/metabolite transporter (DMT)-like permease